MQNISQIEITKTISKNLALKNDQIGFTVINLGNVATEEVMRDIEEGVLQVKHQFQSLTSYRR